MNKLKKIGFSLGIVMLFLHINFASAQPNAGRGISLQVFYDELSYYGDWINNPDYGYVWRPNVGNDFRPYFTNGRWMMTEYGNTWVSDYEWGWAPFHYGRWFYDNYDGWVWVPDTVWGPAWVDWRSGNGYYGWAPLGPRFNININIGTRYYPDNYWVFIPQRCIYYPSYYRYWEPRRNTIIIQNTTIINNIYNNRNVRYYSGPNATDIRRATRQNVRVYKITDAGRSGATRVGNGNINVYRPQVNNVRDARPTSVAANTRPSRSDADKNQPNRNNNTDTRVNRPDGDRNNNSVQRPNSSSTRPNAERPTRENQQPSNTGNNNSTRVPQGSSNVNTDRTTNPQPQPQQRPTQQREVNAPAQRQERPAATAAPAQRQQSEAPAAQRPTRTSSAPSQQQRVERPAASSSTPSRTQSSGNSNSDNSSSSRATRTNR